MLIPEEDFIEILFPFFPGVLISLVHDYLIPKETVLHFVAEERKRYAEYFCYKKLRWIKLSCPNSSVFSFSNKSFHVTYSPDKNIFVYDSKSFERWDTLGNWEKLSSPPSIPSQSLLYCFHKIYLIAKIRTFVDVLWSVGYVYSPQTCSWSELNSPFGSPFIFQFPVVQKDSIYFLNTQQRFSPPDFYDAKAETWHLCDFGQGKQMNPNSVTPVVLGRSLYFVGHETRLRKEYLRVSNFDFEKATWKAIWRRWRTKFVTSRTNIPLRIEDTLVLLHCEQNVLLEKILLKPRLDFDRTRGFKKEINLRLNYPALAGHSSYCTIPTDTILQWNRYLIK